jgi:hypothetical protein
MLRGKRLQKIGQEQKMEARERIFSFFTLNFKTGLFSTGYKGLWEELNDRLV